MFEKAYVRKTFLAKCCQMNTGCNSSKGFSGGKQTISVIHDQARTSLAVASAKPLPRAAQTTFGSAPAVALDKIAVPVKAKSPAPAGSPYARLQGVVTSDYREVCPATPKVLHSERGRLAHQ